MKTEITISAKEAFKFGWYFGVGLVAITLPILAGAALSMWLRS